MWRARAGMVAGLAVLLLAAGCGGDGDEDKGAAKPPAEEQPAGGGKPVGGAGGREAAEAFVACFKEEGYKPQVLRGTAATSALTAKSKGYEATEVWVQATDTVIESANVTFFADEAERKRAVRELNFGSADVPQEEGRGSAVVSYTTKQARERAKAAIDACLR